MPKREELSLRVVLAFPNASRTGLVAKICRSTSLASSRDTLVLDLVLESGGLTEARYRMMNLAYMEHEPKTLMTTKKALRTDSVFPAPLE